MARLSSAAFKENHSNARRIITTSLEAGISLTKYASLACRDLLGERVSKIERLAWECSAE